MMTATAEHLAHARAISNEIRSGIAQFVKETHALPSREGANVVADVFALDAGDRILGAARVRYLLKAVRRLPSERVEKLLVLASARKPDKRLRDLTPRQRDVIAVQLRLWGEGIGS